MPTDYLHHPERIAILERLRPLLSNPLAAGALCDDAFNDLALALFRYQFARLEPFRRLCGARGVGTALDDWRRIPHIPTDAFKAHRMACFPEALEGARFHTSGTTVGRPGVHSMVNTEIYDAAAIPWFALHVTPERYPEICSAGAPPAISDANSFRFISLTLSPADAPHSSLTHMIQTAGERLLRENEKWLGAGGAEPVRYCYGPEGLHLDALADALSAIPPGARVVLFTTAFALAQAIEAAGAAGARGLKLALPAGSRIMETGGYKGRTRALAKSELYTRAADLLGVPVSHIINEYGMTEMSSQFYDPCPRSSLEEPDCGAGLRPASPESRLKRPPPWVRSRALDPATLEEVPQGEIGVLAHTDLANVDSCAFLMTADAALAGVGGFELLGRMDEIEPRGCSLMYEDIGP